MEKEITDNVEKMVKDKEIKELSIDFINKTAKYKYSYNFSWLGRPVIQFPQDLISLQEIIWQTKPDLIIETGVAHGGGLIFYASMMELLGGDGLVIGVDIEIRPHNRVEIEKHRMFKRIKLIEGSSVDLNVIEQIKNIAKNKTRIMVCLDSLHTHKHVLEELKLYSPLITKGCYLVVFDTVIEDMPKYLYPDRPWDKGNNPKTAVLEFLKTNKRFIVDKYIEDKMVLSTAYNGYLKCIRD